MISWISGYTTNQSSKNRNLLVCFQYTRKLNFTSRAVRFLSFENFKPAEKRMEIKSNYKLPFKYISGPLISWINVYTNTHSQKIETLTKRKKQEPIILKAITVISVNFWWLLIHEMNGEHVPQPMGTFSRSPSTK